jgi:hypothetical protein
MEMNLIEVTICDQVFVIAYDEDTTISVLADIALAEYQAAFFERVPSKVKFVHDTKKRILSGTLLVSDGRVEKSLLVELIDSESAGAGAGARRAPTDDICSQYRMWQEYTASRAKQCLETMADSPKREDPSDSFLDMLQDLRRSRFEEVQGHTVGALSVLLDYFRHKKYTMFAMQELQCIVHESVFSEVALTALRKISTSRTSHKYIYPTSRITRDVARLVKHFDEDVQAEFFDLHDYLDSAAANKMDAAASPELMEAERNSRCPRQAPTEAALGPDMDDRGGALSLEAEAKDSGGSGGAAAGEKGETDSPSDTTSAAANIDRIISLLVSDELKNRQYAIRKAVILVWTFAEHPSAPASSALEHRLGKLATALLTCMKSSLKPSGGPRSAKAADAKDAAKDQVKTTLVASLVLQSVNSDLLTVQLCLRCICLLSVCQPVIVRAVLLGRNHSAGSYCKLLTTLAHSKDPFEEVDTDGDDTLVSLVRRMRSDIIGLKTVVRLSGLSSTASICSLHIAEACSMLLLLAMKEEDAALNSFRRQRASIDHSTNANAVAGNASDIQSDHSDNGEHNFNECDALESIGFDMGADARWADPDIGGIKLEPRAIIQLLQTEVSASRSNSDQSARGALSPMRVEFALACLLHMSISSGNKTSSQADYKPSFSRDDTHEWTRSPPPPEQAQSAQEELAKALCIQDFALCKLLWKWLSSDCRRSAVLSMYILGNVTASTSIRSFFLHHRSTVSKVSCNRLQ